MPALTNIQKTLNSSISKTGNALNLSDNIVDNETVVGDFLTMSESAEFDSAILSGIKDFLHKAGEFNAFLQGIIKKVGEFLNKIISYLNLNNLFDALGIKFIADLLLDILGEALFYGILGDRSSILNFLKEGCINLNRDDGLFNMSLINFILTGIILALACAGEKDAFTLLDRILKTEKEEEYNNIIEGIDNSLGFIEGLESEDPIILNNARTRRDGLLANREEVTVKHNAEMDKIDRTIVKVFFLTFNKAEDSATEALLLDMAKLPSFDKAKGIRDTSLIVNFIDKIDSSIEVKDDDLLLYGSKTSLNYNSLKDLLERFDNNLKQSNLLSKLSKLESLGIIVNPSNTARDITDLTRSFIKPRKLPLGELTC